MRIKSDIPTEYPEHPVLLHLLHSNQKNLALRFARTIEQREVDRGFYDLRSFMVRPNISDWDRHILIQIDQQTIMAKRMAFVMVFLMEVKVAFT
ncbi:hypothetical protein ACLOJK_016667 [Asimina triloba]